MIPTQPPKDTSDFRLSHPNSEDLPLRTPILTVQREQLPQHLQFGFQPDDMILFKHHKHSNQAIPQGEDHTSHFKPTELCHLYHMTSPCCPCCLISGLILYAVLLWTFIVASLIRSCLKRLFGVMDNQNQQLSYMYHGFQNNLGLIDFMAVSLDVSMLAIQMATIIILTVPVLVMCWPFFPYGNGCPICHGLGCRLAYDVLGAARCSIVHTAHSFYLFYKLYQRPPSANAWYRKGGSSSYLSVAERIKLLEEGWLVIRLTRYPDIFPYPWLCWLNQIYLAYWDWKRWCTGVLAYTLLKHEGRLEAPSNGYAPLGNGFNLMLENNTSGWFDGDKYLCVWVQPENYLKQIEG